MRQDRITATEARQHFFELVKNVTESHKTQHIKHRTGSVVMMSEEDYDGLMETLELLLIPGFRDSMKRSAQQEKKGDLYSMDDIFGDDE